MIGRSPFKRFKKLKIIFRTEGARGVSVITNRGKLFFEQEDKINPVNPLNAGDVFSGTTMGMITAGYNTDSSITEIISSAQEQAVKVISDDRFYRRRLDAK